VNSLIITKIHQRIWHRTYAQRVHTYMKKKMHRHHLLHAMILIFCVVLVWRGIWGTMDIYLFPGTPIVSYIISTTTGLVILLIVDNLDYFRKA